MQTITTVSDKGQIVIPKKIREKLNVTKSDKFAVEIKDNSILLSPIISSDEALGMFKAEKPISKEDIKESYKQAVQEKHK